MEIQKESGPGGGGWVTDLINKHIDEQAHSHADYKRKWRIRPSEIGECTRKIVYSILNFPTETVPDSRVQRIFQNGHHVHDRYLADYLPKIGLPCKVWVKKRTGWKLVDFIEIMLSDKDLWLRGAPDAIIFNPNTGKKYVFELKSMNQEEFWKLEEPVESHIYQAHLYMYMTKIHKAILLYENKNRQDIKEFEVEYDPEIINFLIRKIRKIQQYVRSYVSAMEVPEREYNAKKCSYCPYAYRPTGCLSDWKKKRRKN